MVCGFGIGPLIWAPLVGYSYLSLTPNIANIWYRVSSLAVDPFGSSPVSSTSSSTSPALSLQTSRHSLSVASSVASSLPHPSPSLAARSPTSGITTSAVLPSRCSPPHLTADPSSVLSSAALSARRSAGDGSYGSTVSTALVI